MEQRISGSVSIHRLRTGETVQLYLSANKGLYQLVSGQNAMPDWTKTDDQPTITPSIPGQKIDHPAWYKDGQIIAGWYKEGNQWKQKATANGYSFSDEGALTITKSPVDFETLRNINYTFRCEVSINSGTPQSIERTIMVTVHNGGENSYWGNINAPRTVLSGTSANDDEYSTTLTPVLYLGSKVITGYDVEWIRNSDNQKITDSSTVKGCQREGNNLKVNREGVNGAEHFTCRFIVDGQLVEAEGIQIADKSDNYYINLDGANDVYVGGTINITPTLVETEKGTAVKVSGWDCAVTDSVRINLYPQNSAYNFNTATGVFSMSEGMMYVPNNDPATKTGKPWLKTDEQLVDGKLQDVPVADIKQATPCDINITITAIL